MSTALQVQVDALVTGIAACLCKRIEDSTKEGLPGVCICAVMPGLDVAADYCDKGMAWTRTVLVQPIVDPTIGEYACGNEWEVTVEVGILRCAPPLGPKGQLPTMEAHLAVSMQQNFDMGLMLKTLLCCEVPSRFDGPAIGPFIPQGPGGGCVGGTWTAKWKFS